MLFHETRTNDLANYLRRITICKWDKLWRKIYLQIIVSYWKIIFERKLVLFDFSVLRRIQLKRFNRFCLVIPQMYMIFQEYVQNFTSQFT